MKFDELLMVIIGILSLIILYKIYKGSLIEGLDGIVETTECDKLNGLNKYNCLYKNGKFTKGDETYDSAMTEKVRSLQTQLAEEQAKLAKRCRDMAPRYGWEKDTGAAEFSCENVKANATNCSQYHTNHGGFCKAESKTWGGRICKQSGLSTCADAGYNCPALGPPLDEGITCASDHAASKRTIADIQQQIQNIDISLLR